MIAKNLDSAMHFAHAISGTDKIIVFDGAVGGINVSASLAGLLREKAPEVCRRVDDELLPKWLRQRGIDPMTVLG